MISILSVTEAELQRLVVLWLDAALPDGAIYHHSPNEGKRHISYNVKLKLLGMKTGFPDLVLFVPTRYFWSGIPCSIFIELKRPKGGKTSPAQKLMHEALLVTGAAVATLNSLAKVKMFLSNFIELKENTHSKILEQQAAALGG
tara:strand:+ start:1541 stop:1972 length:432 start_codon:yes stop_codon:yes gene_type:complete